MIACNIVPCDTIAVYIVENGKAGFVGTIDIEFGVIGLANLLVTSLTPRVESKAVGDLVGRCHLLAGGGPEPTIDALRLQVTAVFTTLEVTQAAAGPDVRDVSLLNQSEDNVVLFLAFHRDKVHAVFSADVSCIEPINSQVTILVLVTAEEVVVASVEEFLRPLRALVRNWQR